MSIDTEQVVREYIDKTVHLSLATVKDNAPWVSEVHFAYDEDLNLYYRSLGSRRHSQEIEGNPNVAGDIIDKYEPGMPIVGVYFEGKAEHLPAGDAQDKAAECLKKRFMIDSDVVSEAADPAGHQFYKITVANWYVFGKFDSDRGEKYQLVWNGGKK